MLLKVLSFDALRGWTKRVERLEMRLVSLEMQNYSKRWKKHKSKSNEIVRPLLIRTLSPLLIHLPTLCSCIRSKFVFLDITTNIVSLHPLIFNYSRLVWIT